MANFNENLCVLPRRNFKQRAWIAVRIALGLLLLTVAGLKLAGRGVSEVPQVGWFAKPTIQVVAAEWEIVLGIWLLSGVYQGGAWFASLMTFLTFAGVSGYLGRLGVASCGCFGAIRGSPWHAFAVDLGALAILVLFRPGAQTSIEHFWSSHVSHVSPRLIVAGALILAIAFSQFGVRTHGLDIERLEIPNDELQVGVVWETSHFRKVMTVTNVGERELEISGWITSCGCTGVEPAKSKLRPGEAEQIVVTVDLANRRRHPNATIEEFSVSFTPKLTAAGNDRIRPPTWFLRGSVRQSLKMPRIIDLGRNSVLSQPLAPTVVRLTGQTPLGGVKATADPKAFAVKVQSCGSNEFDVSVRQTKTLPVGRVSSEVTLTPFLPGGEELPDLVLGIAGEIQADIQVFPEAGVADGARPTGTICEQAITLRSLTGQVLNFERAQADNRAIQVESLRSDSPCSCILLVRYTITVDGAQQHSIQVTIRCGSGESTVCVPVTAYGAPN